MVTVSTFQPGDTRRPISVIYDPGHPDADENGYVTIYEDVPGSYELPAPSELYPWLPPELAQALQDAWVETGEWSIALAVMRGHSSYDQHFAGNRREDGSVRYSEQDYLAMIEGFRDTVEGVGITADTFSDQYASLIAGNVSVTEFQARVDELSARVLVQGDALRQYYAEVNGIELVTDQALIASLMDPDLNTALFDRTITEAEILTEAHLRDLDARGLEDDLWEMGLNRDAAAELFTNAAAQIPILDTLAQRHLDPDNDFDLNEFVQAAILGDADQQRRIRRLFAAEAALFAGGVGFATDATGALVGLEAR